jgi:Ca-activated chloride channel family protein
MIMDDTSLHFAQPFWIIAGLVACAGVVGLFIRFDRRREADLTKLIHPRFRQRLTEGFSPGMRNLKRGLWLLAVLLVFTAVARPQKGYEWREVKRKGIDILFAVDTSRSMLADDLTPNRLERARLGIIDFVSRLEGDRVGLIPFAGSAFALCPLTLDYEAFRESLNALDTDLIPRQGTDLASAIKEAERLFKENGNNHRVLVLLTDGEDLQGDVIDAAKAAAKNGMAIYTIGVGSPGGSTIPLVMRNGRKDFVRDETGSVVRTTLDETTLKKIATETNALYVPLGRGAEGLNTIYQEKLRLVPKSERDQRMERIPLERFEWPLGAAIFLLLLEFFLTDRRRAKKARPLPSAARRHKIVPQATALIGLAFILSGALKTVSAAQDPRRIYNEGTQAYTNGDFAKASESLRSSLRTQDLALQQRSYYNLGNTLYRTGQGTLEKDPEATIKTWEESLKAYQDALSLNAADKDADYNKVLVEKKLEELKNQQKQDDKKDDQDKKDDSEKEDGKDQKDSKDSKDGKDPKDGEKPKDGKDSKEGEKPGDKQDSKDGKDPKDGEKPEDAKDSKDGKKPGEEKSPQDGKDAKEGDEKSGEKQQGEMSNARAEKQEMTAEEAKQLLEALRQDERMVIPIPQQPRGRMATPVNSTKGKTW